MTQTWTATKSRDGPFYWGIVIYTTLALAAFAFPNGLVDWLQERNGEIWVAAPLAIANAIDFASTLVGAKAVGVEARRMFAAQLDAESLNSN
jgi:hypothetical protein